ncbi:S-adenosyl-L-methionine-dependent methyltransferase [Sporodiniella umbellata]|nr:S-adenosyl-L-methionine-dependent methyltransferase [Sporodiniella umbellata]
MDTDALNKQLILPAQSLITNREFHNEENATYWLPKDQDEHDRLTGQHFCFKELVKGNISSSAKEILNFEEGVSVLDIGCGSGAWLADMNSEYPNCKYYGCDIIDIPDLIRKLPKLNFVHGNVSKRLPYKDNTFDFTHMRFFVYGLRADEWPNAIKEIVRVTKPGGMIQLFEGSFVPPEDKESICYKTVTAINNFATKRDQIPNIVYELESLVALNNSVQVVQNTQVTAYTNNGTILAKKFVWNFVKGVEGTIKYLGDELGVESEDEVSDYLNKFKEDMFKSGLTVDTISLSLCKK